jgi:membrane protease YdiL (CAAX protease family)
MSISPHPSTVTPSFWLLAGLQLGLVALAILLLAVWPQPLNRWGTLGAAAILWGVIAAAVTYALLAAASRYSTVMQRHIQPLLARVRPLFARLAWWQLLAIALLAGLGEELLFRVFLQPAIASFTSPWLAIAIASLVFAALHFLSWLYFLLTLVVGALLGAAYYVTQSVVLVILWHGIYDVIALWVLVYAPHLLGVAAAPQTR